MEKMTTPVEDADRVTLIEGANFDYIIREHTTGEIALTILDYTGDDSCVRWAYYKGWASVEQAQEFAAEWEGGEHIDLMWRTDQETGAMPQGYADA